MSIDAIRWAWQLKLSPTRKLVLLALADRAGENHECYPSIARLEADTGLHRQTIMEAIVEMETASVLRVVRQIGKGSRYELIGVPNRHQDEKADRYGKAHRYGKADHTGTENRTPTSTEKRTPTSTENRTENLPVEPTIEPTKNRGLATHDPKPATTPKGTRLPNDWTLPAEWGRWALATYPHLAKPIVLEMAAAFRDYWVAKPGNATKLDWEATWRNWVRKDQARHLPKAQPQPAQEEFRASSRNRW